METLDPDCAFDFVTKLVDVFVVQEVFESFRLHLPVVDVDEVPGGLVVRRGAQVRLLS